MPVVQLLSLLSEVVQQETGIKLGHVHWVNRQRQQRDAADGSSTSQLLPAPELPEGHHCSELGLRYLIEVIARSP